MKTRNLWIFLGLMSTCSAVFGQQAAMSTVSADEMALKNLPKLVLPAGYASRPLPAKKDNTRVIYFSGIYSQEVWNCNQASSIWTMFTYEINYLRNLNSSETENQYSPMAVYNLLNYGIGSNGVSYFDSWNVVKANGIPRNPDFTAYSQNSTTWMTGYDKYYRGMKNRVDEVFAIDVSNPDGLLTLKHWINDHLNGAQVGGLANFQIGSGDMVIPQIPMDKGLEEEGQYIVIKYGPFVGHAMTFAGWNDSIRYDVNGDGRYTNNIDINGDSKVDMKDWEIGAMLVVNSWGVGWGNAGKVWVMYRLLAEPPSRGGIWNNAAMVVKPKKTYEPQLTVKASIRYNQRSRLKIQVGVAADLNARLPEHTLDFSCFNFQGDALPMQGFVDLNSDLIEIGLDITPLKNFIPENGEAKIFLEVVQKSPDDLGAGAVEAFSVLDYGAGSHEFTSTESPATIVRNSVTRLSVPIATYVSKPQIITEQLDDALVGTEYRFQIEADGTTGPYRYDNPANTYLESAESSSISMTGGTKVFSDPGVTAQVVDLPFSFPMYGLSYDQVVVLQDGGIVMGPALVNYPYVIDQRLRFYQHPGIYPFLTNLHFPHLGSQVTFEGSSAEAIIRWTATLDIQGTHHAEFALKLLPDGKIFFYYGNIDLTPDINWIAGLSAGNNLDYHLMESNFAGLTQYSACRLEKLVWPEWLTLGTNGDLKGTPDKSGFYTLPFTVTDWSGIRNSKNLTLKVTGGGSGVDAEALTTIRVWPNPVTDEVWLEGQCTAPGTITFTVFDLAGRVLLTEQFAGQPGFNSFRCTDVKELGAGVYLYRLSGAMESRGKLVRGQ